MNKQRFIAAFELIGVLAERFPAAFAIKSSHRRPLKRGVHSDILAQLSTIVPRDLSTALRVYTTNIGYLSATVAGADRVNLNGMPAGTVTAEEAAYAKVRCQCWHDKSKTKAKQKQLAVAPAKPIEPPKPVAAAPRRVSLADLRAAAQARRQAAA